MAPKRERHLFLELRTSHYTERHANLSVRFCRPDTSTTGDITPAMPDSIMDPEADAFGVALSAMVGVFTYDEGKAQTYSWDIGLHLDSTEWHPVDIDKADRALKLARKMKANVTRLSDTYGRPQTFGQFVAYAVDTLNVTSILRRRQPNDMHDGSKFVQHGRDMIAYTIDAQAERLKQYVAGAIDAHIVTASR